MTVYQIWQRGANGQVEEIARVEVEVGRISWSGNGTEMVLAILTERSWIQLEDRHFDDLDPNDYKLLPELLQGSRLWVVAK